MTLNRVPRPFHHLLPALALSAAVAAWPAAADTASKDPKPSAASQSKSPQSASSTDASESSRNPAAGLNPALPALNLNRDLGSLSQRTATGGKDAAASASGANPAAQQLREQTGSLANDKNLRPGFDQGFVSKPGAVDGAAAGKGNPIGSLTGGSNVFLGAPAAETKTGIAGQGKGAISDGFFGDKKRSGADQVDNEDKKADRSFETKTGLTITVYGDGGFTISDGKVSESYDKNNQRCKKGTSGSTCNDRPLPPGEGRGSPEDLEKFLAANPAIAAQLRQAGVGDGGRIDPARGDDGGFSHGDAPVISGRERQQNLVGQPGQAGGLQEHGAVQTGFNFNNKNFGAVDPGPDGTVTAGNREDGRVADAIGGSPSRELPTQSCDADGRTADTADDCAKP